MATVVVENSGDRSVGGGGVHGGTDGVVIQVSCVLPM